jgi:hypothetical protein
VDRFISQFPRVANAFKYFKVYWSNDQDGVYLKKITHNVYFTQFLRYWK